MPGSTQSRGGSSAAKKTRGSKSANGRTPKTARSKKNGSAAEINRTGDAKPKVTHYPPSPLVEVRDSDIHGSGVYAKRPIKKGMRIIEYLGDRVSHAEADRRYEEKADDDNHTFLFIVDGRTVIDAGFKGNEARFINHSCDPNCETVIEGRRVFVEAIRDIKAGDELGYEYQLTWDSTDDPDELALYRCLCGAKQCRGTMLDPEPLDKQEKKAKKKGKKKAEKKAKKKTKTKKKSKR